MIRGLKYLVGAYKSSLDKLNLSMVYTPPFSEKKIDRVINLWAEHPWIPRNLKVTNTYPSRGTIPAERFNNQDQEVYMSSKQKKAAALGKGMSLV